MMTCKNRKKKVDKDGLTQALEDYLLTIFQFNQAHGFVRVKDIVRARNVKAGSVSPAMRRLSELGLVEYVQREYIKLTEAGEKEARKIFSRHELLSRFFHEILKMELEESELEACAMEHSLSENAMDKLVRFFEFLHVCPNAFLKYWERFQTCKGSHPMDHQCDKCTEKEQPCITPSGGCQDRTRPLSDLKPGDKGVILKIGGAQKQRRAMLDRGILPESPVEIDHLVADGIIVTVGGYSMKITESESRNIFLV